MQAGRGSPPGAGTGAEGSSGSGAAAAAGGTLDGDGGVRAAGAGNGRRHVLLRGRRGVHGVEEGDDVAVLRKRGDDALGELHRVEQLDEDEVVELRERLLLGAEVRAQPLHRVGGVERVSAALEEGRRGDGGAGRDVSATCSCCGGHSRGAGIDEATCAGVGGTMHVPSKPMSRMHALHARVHASPGVQHIRTELFRGFRQQG